MKTVARGVSFVAAVAMVGVWYAGRRFRRLPAQDRVAVVFGLTALAAWLGWGVAR